MDYYSVIHYFFIRNEEEKGFPLGSHENIFDKKRLEKLIILDFWRFLHAKNLCKFL